MEMQAWLLQPASLGEEREDHLSGFFPPVFPSLSPIYYGNNCHGTGHFFGTEDLPGLLMGQLAKAWPIRSSQVAINPPRIHVLLLLIA